MVSDFFSKPLCSKGLADLLGNAASFFHCWVANCANSIKNKVGEEKNKEAEKSPVSLPPSLCGNFMPLISSFFNNQRLLHSCQLNGCLYVLHPIPTHCSLSPAVFCFLCYLVLLICLRSCFFVNYSICDDAVFFFFRGSTLYLIVFAVDTVKLLFMQTDPVRKNKGKQYLRCVSCRVELSYEWKQNRFLSFMIFWICKKKKKSLSVFHYVQLFEWSWMIPCWLSSSLSAHLNYIYE